MNLHRESRIFLTGFMGCGKSTVAPVLAGTLGFECFDIDLEIERRAGNTVSGIFAARGERAFRALEREVLFATAPRRRVVVALGGGTIVNEANFDFVASTGLLVYLRVDFETLFARLRTKGDRPLLVATAAAGLTPEEELREAMARLLAVREPFYNRADITVGADPGDPGRTAAVIAAAISRLSPGGPVT